VDVIVIRPDADGLMAVLVQGVAKSEGSSRWVLNAEIKDF
jgi:hypothetical protein